MGAEAAKIQRNGVAVDDTDVRGGGRGCRSNSPDIALSKSNQISYRFINFAHPSTFTFHRPLRRFSAPRYIYLILFLFYFFQLNLISNLPIITGLRVLSFFLFTFLFGVFLLLDIYWKNEHRLMCTGEICTAAERDRYEKSVISLLLSFFSVNFQTLFC